MVKLNLIRFSAMMFACFMAGTVANAQTVIWGVGSANTASIPDAQFANAFVQASSFSPGDNPSAWTALSVSDNSGAPGAAYWTRSTLGYSEGAYWTGTTPLATPSQANGVAIFDSDFMDNAGIRGNFGNGTSPSPHRGELISPSINLTGYTDSALVISCASYYREFSINTLGFAISTDGGASWTEGDFRGTLPTSTLGTASAVFPNVTAGVTNLSDCRIKLIFDGDYYFAIVDDVSIGIAQPYNVTVGNPRNDNSVTILNRGDFVKVGGAVSIAYENLDPTDLREWFFGGKMVNLGYRDILPSDNPRFHLAIDYTDPLTGATTMDVYRDSINYDTIPGNDPLGYTDIAYLSDIQFIMDNKAGNYTVKYWCSHDQMEGDMSNDTASYTLVVTDEDQPIGSPYTKNFLSRVGAANDGGSFANSAIFPGGGPYSRFEYGTVYYFPKGLTDTIRVDSISYRYRLSGSFNGAATQTLFCHVYEMDPSTGTLDGNNVLTQIGIAPFTLNGLGTTLAPGDFGLTTIANLTDASLGSGPMPLFKDNGFYFFSVVIEPSLTGGGGTFASTDVPWIGSTNDINYSMNAAMTRADSVINPSPLSLTDAAGTQTWNWIGFGADDIPAISLWLSSKDPRINTQVIWETEGAEMSVFPNPASDVVNVEFSLEEADDVMYIMTDVTGRVVNILNSTNVTNEVKTIDVSNLATGTYFITAKTSKGTSTQRVVVQ